MGGGGGGGQVGGGKRASLEKNPKFGQKSKESSTTFNLSGLQFPISEHLAINEMGNVARMAKGFMKERSRSFTY